jgi:hypothetical protein
VAAAGIVLGIPMAINNLSDPGYFEFRGNPAIILHKNHVPGVVTQKGLVGLNGRRLADFHHEADRITEDEFRILCQERNVPFHGVELE